MCPVMAPAVARRAWVGVRMRARAAMVRSAVRVAMMVLMGRRGDVLGSGDAVFAGVGGGCFDDDG